MELLSNTTLIAMLLIFVGSFVQTAIGFGLAVVASPLLFFLSPDYVPTPITLIALLISLWSALKLRADVSIGKLKNALIWRIPGSIAGGFLLVWVSTEQLALWLGILVLFAVAVSLLPSRIEPTPFRMGVAGFFSGLFGTSSAIGGPPMALLLQHQEANQLRGNLAAFFVFSSLISLLVQFAVGHTQWHHLIMTIPLIPSAWAGYKLAGVVTQHISKSKLRFFTLALCSASGLMAIYKSF